ncbi:metallophosphoesterase [Candidatus Bipolaricaulota bacterium]|nr:metallophosphoesterase [Candidatus Bipolaricaulota bacterium]
MKAKDLAKPGTMLSRRSFIKAMGYSLTGLIGLTNTPRGLLNQTSYNTGKPPIIGPSKMSYVVLPDTQYYCSHNNGIFQRMTQWIVENLTTYNIKMVLHEGDIVNDPTRIRQWEVAKEAIDNLDRNSIPTLLSLGNHDAVTIRNPIDFRRYFPVSRYSVLEDRLRSISEYGTYEGHPENAYLKQEVGKHNFLYLTLEFAPRRSVVEWARKVIEKHSHSFVVVVTHLFLYHDGSLSGARHPHNASLYGLTDHYTGEKLWEDLISRSSDIKVVHSGHHVNGPYSAVREGHGVNGNRVSQQYANYQDMYNGGDGWMRMVTVDMETWESKVSTYTPYGDEWSSDPLENFNVNFDRWVS